MTPEEAKKAIETAKAELAAAQQRLQEANAALVQAVGNEPARQRALAIVIKAKNDVKRAEQLVKNTEQGLIDANLQAQNDQRGQLVKELQGIANGGGVAYGTVQKQVGAGNRRIAALASTGRGGMNANLNAANAQGQNKIAGQQAAQDAKAQEMTQAQGALGQVIAQGQDANNAAIQQQIADLQYQFGQTPAENPYVTGANIAGNLGQAAYSIYGQNQAQDPSQKNKNNSGWQ